MVVIKNLFILFIVLQEVIFGMCLLPATVTHKLGSESKNTWPLQLLQLRFLNSVTAGKNFA